MSQAQSHSLPPSPSPRHIRHPRDPAQNANGRLPPPPPPPPMHLPPGQQPSGLFPGESGRASPRLGGIVIRDSDSDPIHARFPSHEQEPSRGPAAGIASPTFRHGYGHNHGQGHARSASDSFTKPRLPASAPAPPSRHAAPPVPSSALARRSSSASLNPATPQPVRLPGTSTAVAAMADPLARLLSELSSDFRKRKLDNEDELLSLQREDLTQRITHLESLADRVHEARAMAQARIKRMSSSPSSTTPPLLPPLPPAFPHRPVSQLSTFSVESAATTSIATTTTTTAAAAPPAATSLAPTHPLRVSYSKLEHLAESIAVEIALYRQFATDDLDTLLTTAITFNDDDADANAHASSPPYGAATSLSIPTTDAPLHAHSSSHAGDPSDRLLHNPHALAWVPNPVIQSTLAQFQLGKCTCIHASWPLLAIGTSRGAVAVFATFSSSVQLAHILRAPARDPNTPPLAPITALSLSTSHAFLATGHQDGLVCLWSVPKQTLIKRVLPQPAGSTQYGHAQGTRITHVVFVGASNRRLISVDHLGVVFYSVVMLSLKQPLQAMFTSGVDVRRFFGSYANRLNKSQLTTVFEVASVGGTRYVALITPFKLVILDTKPVRTVYRALRVETAAPELASGTASICGALCVVGSTLFATWGNWMRVLSVEVVAPVANGTAAGADDLSVRHVADLVLERDVVAMRQLDSKYLTLVTNDPSIDLLSLTSLSVTESAPVPTSSLVGFDDLLAVSHNLGPRAQLNYTPSITSLVPPPTAAAATGADSGGSRSGQLVSLGENNTLFTATLVPAAHRLLALATAGDVPKLVHFALDWVFHGCAAYAVGKTDGELAAWEMVDGAAGDGDESGDNNRAGDAVVVDLVCSAALQALRATLNPADDVPQLMHLLATVPGAEPFMYAQFAEAADVLTSTDGNADADTRQAYTHNLARLLLDNLVTRSLVPPAILSTVLADLVRAGNVAQYTRLLRVVNVAQVDVDAAVRVCKAEGIPSGLVHLYVAMGQVEVGLLSVPRDVAVGFVAEAVEGSEYREEEVGGMVQWVVERVARLFIRWEVDEVEEGGQWAELIARCVRAIVKRSSSYRDSMVTELKRIRALQALDEHDGDDAANMDAETEAAIFDARRAFANALLAVTARDFAQDVSLTSAEYFATLTQLVSAFDPSTHSSSSSAAAAVASPLWPPRVLVEEAIIHLMSVLTLSQDQLIDLAAQCEDRRWWRVREHMARQAGDIAHVLDCLVLDPDRAGSVFDLVATELEPLAASMDAAASGTWRTDRDAGKWDMDLVAEVSQRLLALMIPLCSMDVDKCAWLVASRARPLVLAAHKALADTPFQGPFRMALAEMDPSPVTGPLLRECLLDIAKLAGDGGEEAADSAALRFVARHEPVCSKEDMETWVEVCQAFHLTRTEAHVWEAMGRPESALARLLEAAMAATARERDQAIVFQTLAVALCRRIGSEELWVQLVQSLLHSSSSLPSIEPILREALLGMRDIPRILARLIHSQPRNSALSPALLHGMLTALSAHRMKLGFSEAVTRMVRHECLDQASVLFSAYRRGFYIPRTTDTRHPVPCALCGTFSHLHVPTGAPGTSNEQCAWSCGHVVHSQCVRSGAATADLCPICSHDRQAQLHVAEVMGKRPAGRGSPGIATGKGKGKAKARAGAGMVVGTELPGSPYASAMSSPAVASPLPSAGLIEPVNAAAASGGGGEAVMDRVQDEERFGAPEFYRPRPPEWHAMLKAMLHQVEDEDDDY